MRRLPPAGLLAVLLVTGCTSKAADSASPTPSLTPSVRTASSDPGLGGGDGETSVPRSTVVTTPSGTLTNDAGAKGYLGPCPPAGDVTHHYRITVYALDVPSLDLPAETPATVTTFTMSGHIIGHADMAVTARR